MVQHRTHMRCSHTVDVSLSPDRDLPEWRELRDKVRDDSDRMLKLTLTDENSELSVVICSDSYIADLNRTWRQVDGPTDVLSFPQDDDTVCRPLHPPPRPTRAYTCRYASALAA